MTINLIPTKLKKEKELKKNLNLVFVILSVMLVMLFITTGTIYAANIFVKKDLEDINYKINEQTFTLKKYSQIEDNIKTVNSKLKKINSANSDKIIWSNVLQDLSNSTPQLVQITTFSANKETSKISITGLAETRRDIAKLKEKMENSKYFQNVTFSSSVHKSDTDNYNFNMSCDIEEIK